MMRQQLSISAGGLFDWTLIRAVAFIDLISPFTLSFVTD
jgi:hypothetical protein